MATQFPQLDDIETQVAVLREMRKPALLYLLTEAAGALYLAARLLLPTIPRPLPRTVTREYRDRPGYWSERVYTHAEVKRDLAKAWATSVKQSARATESLETPGD